MARKIKIAAFGALNQASYGMFDKWAQRFADEKGVELDIRCAGPYPNAQAISVPGRPLRGDALKDPALEAELCEAVAADARALGDGFDVYCMPCMSMVGFHDGVEKALDRPIVRLADALAAFYADVPRLGVIHMRPAAQRVKEIFGGRAVTPDAAQAERLLAAEEQAKTEKNSAPVEDVMKDITESFRDQGLSHVLFARADAPTAQDGPAGQVDGIQINSYFDILARHIIGLASGPA